MSGEPLNPTDFASAVTAITSAFGDPTRRAIYLFAHEVDGGVTASAVNQHLRVLRDAGLLISTRYGRSVLYLRSELGSALLESRAG